MNSNHNKKVASSSSVKNIRTAFFLNIVFTVVEIIGGVMTNSVAIMADALHDLGDSFSFGLAWYLEKYSNKKRTNLFSYGYKRFSLLGAFVNALVLLFGSIFILWQTIPRLINPVPANASGMVWLAMLGVVVNGIAAYKTMQGKSMNEKMVSLNLLEDVFGWAVILVASIVMLFTNWIILDPLLSVFVVSYILIGVFKNLKQVVLLFLQAAPKNLKPNFIKKKLLKVSLVEDVHDIHIWSLDGERHILSAHIVIQKNTPKEKIRSIRKEIKKILQGIGISHSTLEIEFEGEECLDDNDVY